MIVVAGLLLLVAALGLVAVRSAPRAARLAAFGAVVAFVLPQALPLDVAFVPDLPRRAGVTLPAAPADVLAAAAVAGPAARDLEFAWREPLAGAAAEGPLGAIATLPAPALPVDPRAVRVRALGTIAVGRPVVLQIEAPGLDERTAGELVVQRADVEVARLPFALAADGTADVAWLPRAAGAHTFALALTYGSHRLLGDGRGEVEAAPRVLVLDPSGVAAAALAAQDVAVENVAALPPDWREAHALVLGRALSDDQQLAVTAAAISGLGVLALAPAFGAEGAPLRALLPLRPLPRQPGGDAGGAGGGEPTAAEPPPTTPPEPPTPPEPERPPDGSTRGAGPVGGEPIEVDKRAIAMVLVVDRSGSMGTPLSTGLTKMSYAKTSAERTARALGPGDQVGIVTFGNEGAGRVELPLSDATDVTTVRGGIERLAHGPEYTYLLSGLQRAAELLAPSPAAVKHVVVITDGEFDLRQAVALQSLAGRLRREARTTLSVVSIVDERTEPSFRREAERLAQAGGGQFLPVEDATFVPTLVSAEVTRALERVGREPNDTTDRTAPPRDEPPPPPPRDEPPPPLPRTPPPSRERLAVRQVAPSPLLLPETETWPTLGGATPGTAPLDAQVLLVAGEAGWPLLAFGNRGLGRIGAFAADLGGEDGREFRADPAFPGRFAQWVAAVLRPLPVREPVTLLDGARVEPPTPTAQDVAWLEALAGAPPRVGPLAEPPPPLLRAAESALPRWSLALLLVLVGLAVVERYAGLWSLRRGGA